MQISVHLIYGQALSLIHQITLSTPSRRPWLSRSGTWPLDIVICRHRHEHHLNTVIGVVQAHSIRWKSFTIVWDDSAALKLFCDVLETLPCPQLTMISIRDSVSSAPLHTTRFIIPWEVELQWPLRGHNPEILRALDMSLAPLNLRCIQQLSGLRILRLHQASFLSDPGLAWPEPLRAILVAVPLPQALIVDRDAREVAVGDRVPEALIMKHLCILDIQDSIVKETFLSFVRLPAVHDLRQSISVADVSAVFQNNTLPNLRGIYVRHYNHLFFPALPHHAWSFPAEISYFGKIESVTMSGFYIREGDLDGLGAGCPVLRELAFHSGSFDNFGLVRQMIETRAALRRPKLVRLELRS